MRLGEGGAGAGGLGEGGDDRRVDGRLGDEVEATVFGGDEEEESDGLCGPIFEKVRKSRAPGRLDFFFTGCSFAGSSTGASVSRELERTTGSAFVALRRNTIAPG